MQQVLGDETAILAKEAEFAGTFSDCEAGGKTLAAELHAAYGREQEEPG